MPSLNPTTINESKNENNFILSNNFLTDIEDTNISWNRVIDIFGAAKSCNAINFYSFATASIDINKVQTSFARSYIKKIMDSIQQIHSGDMIASSLSISFIGKDNNEIKDDYQLEFKKIFELHNHFKTPKNLPNFADIKTPKIFYSVDTFFVQTNGTSYWKIDAKFPEDFILNPGDIVFIPKKLVHTAEYLSPGSMLSLSFSD